MNSKLYEICLILTLLTVLAVASEPVFATEPEPTMKLYFTEFNAETYKSMTMENIEKSRDYDIFFYRDHIFIDDIQTVLEKRRVDDKIDNNQIRLKVVLAKDNKEVIYYVDSDGVALKNSKETFILEKAAMQKLQLNILYFNDVVDMRPNEDPWGESSSEIFPPRYSPLWNAPLWNEK